MFEDFKISQSSLKRFFEPDFCQIRWVEEFVHGVEFGISDLWERGKYFEYELIGACRDERVPTLPKSKRDGSKLSDERNIDWIVSWAKPMMKKMGIKISEVQPEWIHNNLIAHPDFIGTYKGRRAIFDVKYTETAIRDNHNGWGNVEDKDHTQPVHYILMDYLMTGEWTPFYYIIFGKSGWVRFIQVILEEDELVEYHYQNIQLMEERLKTFKPKPINDFNTCKACDLYEKCKHATRIPQLEQVRI